MMENGRGHRLDNAGGGTMTRWNALPGQPPGNRQSVFIWHVTLNRKMKQVTFHLQMGATFPGTTDDSLFV